LRPSSRLLFLIAAAMLVVSSVSYGSGFSFFEQGAKATAMAGAFSATADDPSAIFYNVAGIAQQRKAAVMFGGTTVNFSNQFTGDPNDPFTSGTTGHYARHTFVIPNAYAVLPVGQNLTFGVGVFTPFGLRTNWADPWVGRFSSRDANIKTINVEPAVAWQTTDGRLAIGIGADYRRGRVMLNQNIPAYNPFTQRIADVGNAYLSSDWDTAWGWNAGILFKPSSAWRIGASYRAPMTIDFGGTATFTQIKTNTPLDPLAAGLIPPSQNVATAINFPGTAIAGVAYSGWNNWTIEGDVTHTNWSRFKQLDVHFLTTPAANITRVENWKDTYSYRLGMNKDVTPDWSVRFGALYDQNPQPTNVVSPLLPDADRLGATLGVGWRSKSGLFIDATEFVLHFKNRSTNGQSLENFNGSYKTNANLITVDFGYRF